MQELVDEMWKWVCTNMITFTNLLAKVREMQQAFPFYQAVKCYDVILKKVRLTLPTPQMLGLNKAGIR